MYIWICVWGFKSYPYFSIAMKKHWQDLEPLFQIPSIPFLNLKLVLQVACVLLMTGGRKNRHVLSPSLHPSPDFYRSDLYVRLGQCEAFFLSFFLGWRMTNLGRMLTLSLRLSQLRLTNLFFVLFLEQPRLPNADRQHNHLENSPNFLCLRP